MRELGRIVRLQIQRATLKTGDKPARVYSPAPLLAVARLEVLQVAHPCRPFSGWALDGRVESEMLKETLQFLDDGMRGFYCQGVGSGIVSVGDRVVLV